MTCDRKNSTRKLEIFTPGPDDRVFLIKLFLILHLKTWVCCIVVFGKVKRKRRMQWNSVVLKSFQKVSTTKLYKAWPAQLSRHYFVPCADPLLFFSFFIEYSRALTALILPSIPACYPDVTLDSPHDRDLIKTCQNIWEVRLPGMQLANVASQQRNQRAVRSFYEDIRQTWQHSQSLINGPPKHSILLMCSEKK